MAALKSHAQIFSVFAILLLAYPPSINVLAQNSAGPTDPYNYARVTPSMAIIIVVLIAALFFMGFFSIYIRHCTRRNADNVQSLNNTGRRAAAARGLDQSIIDTFPTFVYLEVKGLKIGKGALECAVCLCEFEDDETLRLLPKCDHVFHPDCIDAWLSSHTTCPVCRANLSPQPADPPTQTAGSAPDSSDLEAQNDAVPVVAFQPEELCDPNAPPVGGASSDPQPEVLTVSQTLNRNRTRGSRSGRPPKFPRSHSTGHSLIQPGENTDRFTLRLPDEVRKQIMNRKLNRTMSLVVFSRERSSRSGYKTGVGEGSSKGKSKRVDQSDQGSKSDRWVFNRTPSFLSRASSFLTRASTIRSPKVAANDGEGTSNQPAGPDVVQPARPPV